MVTLNKTKSRPKEKDYKTRFNGFVGVVKKGK
jgi:hypothetical protein